MIKQRIRFAAAIIVAGGLALVCLKPTRIAALQPSPGRWITAWGTSQTALGATPITNATVRMITRVTIAGEAVRIRLDNTFGTTPLLVGKAYVGLRIQGAALAQGSNRQLMFAGAPNVTVPAGGSVESDELPMTVIAGQDLAVSLYVPESARPSQHGNAYVTSYMSADGAGDVAASEARTPFTRPTTALLWVKAVSVLSRSSSGAIVAFGDSITDGTCSTLDSQDRWEDWLSVRLAFDDHDRGNRGAFRAIVNEGIGGSTFFKDYDPPLAVPTAFERIERDVFSHRGVTHVVVFMGTNDIRRGASAQRVIAGMQDVLAQVKARGMKAIAVTIIPRHVTPPPVAAPGQAPAAPANGPLWNAEHTKIRRTVNDWLRSKTGFDGVLDFDQIVRDPKDPDLLHPPFNCGDGTHPSPLGYYEMGKSIRLELFK